MQDAATFSGVLDDFTALSFRVLVSIQPPQTFESINEKAPLYVVFSDGRTTLYTGECRIIRQTESKRERSLVLEPVYGEETKPRRDRLYREGHVLVPRPSLAFNHPLVKKENKSRRGRDFFPLVFCRRVSRERGSLPRPRHTAG